MCVRGALVPRNVICATSVILGISEAELGRYLAALFSFPPAACSLPGLHGVVPNHRVADGGGDFFAISIAVARSLPEQLWKFLPVPPAELRGLIVRVAEEFVAQLVLVLGPANGNATESANEGGWQHCGAPGGKSCAQDKTAAVLPNCGRAPELCWLQLQFSAESRK